MKPEELQQDKKYIYISPKPWSKTHTITYTGTARDVKDLLHWFFRTSDNSTIFLNADEVKTLSENKLQINDAPTPETDAAWQADKDTVLRVETSRRIERERDEARELVKVYQEYTKLLCDEINDTAALAYVHGWRTNRYEEGKVLREKIKQLEETK